MHVGVVGAIYRYPVKSVRGEPLAVAEMGWHGLDGDRRLAFRRLDDRSGFPWLTAGRLADLIPFAPHRAEADVQATFRRTCVPPTAMTCQSSASLSPRRSGVVTGRGVLSFGSADTASAITVTMRDVRCSMVNLDPDTAATTPTVMKAVVRANQNNAGVYGGGHTRGSAGDRSGR